MARCRCQEVECSCRLTNGPNIAITGEGTSAAPWIISALPTSEDTFDVDSTNSLELSLAGQGSTLSPYVVSGNVNINPVLQLGATSTVTLHKVGAGNEISPLVLTADATFVDLSAPGNTGDVLSKRADGRYVPAPISSAPGSIFATGGIAGDGTFANPLHMQPTVFASMATLDASSLPNGSQAIVTGIGVFIKGSDGAWRATDDPAGTLRPTINAAADLGWALMNGQTLVNAQTLFPRLWGMAPAAWKAGANLTLPNMDNRAVMGAGATNLGVTGGANTATISAAQLPSHTHSIDHDHPSVSTGFVSNDHAHPVNIQSGGVSNQHLHYFSGGSNYVVAQSFGGGGSNIATQAGTGTPANLQTTDAENVDHSHGVNGTTGGITSNHNHGVDIPNYSGGSGAAGGGSAMSIVPAHLAVTWQIRTY